MARPQRDQPLWRFRDGDRRLRGPGTAGARAEGLAGNTLLFFTSDNGCSPSADFPALLAKGHNPSYILRGYKADIWDGGHRVPLIVRWPGRGAARFPSDQLVSLMDLMATCAESWA